MCPYGQVGSLFREAPPSTWVDLASVGLSKNGVCLVLAGLTIITLSPSGILHPGNLGIGSFLSLRRKTMCYIPCTFFIAPVVSFVCAHCGARQTMPRKKNSWCRHLLRLVSCNTLLFLWSWLQIHFNRQSSLIQQTNPNVYLKGYILYSVFLLTLDHSIPSLGWVALKM